MVTSLELERLLEDGHRSHSAQPAVAPTHDCRIRRTGAGMAPPAVGAGSPFLRLALFSTLASALALAALAASATAPRRRAPSAAAAAAPTATAPPPTAPSLSSLSSDRRSAAVEAEAAAAAPLAAMADVLGLDEEGRGASESSADPPGAGTPRYARVNGTIETLWQRPPGAHPKGVAFIAHGCAHQAPDVFSERAPDGADFEGCEKSYLGRCLALPEEVHLRREALSRGYLVVAVSGGQGKKSCWMGADVPKVMAAVKHVLNVEGLPEDTPIIATGASSGGALVGLLAMPGGLPHLKCIVPQVSSTDALTFGNFQRKVPALYVYMPRDGMTADVVEDDYLSLHGEGIRTATLEVMPRPVDAAFLGRCLKEEVAEDVAAALKSGGFVDDKGLLKEDPRKRTWVSPVHEAIAGRSSDTLEADESCISERMNVAYAFHEFTAEYAKDMFDFCEEAGRFAPGGSGYRHHAATIFGAGGAEA